MFSLICIPVLPVVSFSFTNIKKPIHYPPTPTPPPSLQNMTKQNSEAFTKLFHILFILKLNYRWRDFIF